MAINSSSSFSSDSPSSESSMVNSAELESVFSRAAELHESRSDGFDISFTSLLLGFLAAKDQWSSWFQEYVTDKHIKTDLMLSLEQMSLEALKAVATQTVVHGGQRGYRFTSSAERILHSADELKGTLRVGNPESFQRNYQRTTHHVLGAYIYRLPEDHIQHMKDWGFDRRDWGEAFLKNVKILNKEELRRWTGVHNQIFGKEQGSKRPGPPLQPATNLQAQHLRSKPQQPIPVDRSNLHLDNASLEDHLGRKGFAQALAEQLNRIWDDMKATQARSSFIMHIHGPWGSGKTSLLNLLKAELQPRPKSPSVNKEVPHTARWIAVDFNAWQHQRVDPPWWTFMDSLYRQAATQLRVNHRKPFCALRLSVREWLWRFLNGRLYVLIALAVSVIALLFFGQSLLQFIKQNQPTSDSKDTLTRLGEWGESISGLIALLGTIWTAILLSTRSIFLNSPASAQTFVQRTSDPMESIAKHFRSLLKVINEPVIVLIDDLDRCQQPYVVQLLEGIQTLFNDSRVVYVVTADRRWLYCCFEKTYAQFADSVKEPGRRLGALFLEKAFEFSVSLPRMSPDIKKAYWDFLIMGIGSQTREQLNAERERLKEEFAGAASETEVLEKLKVSETQPIVQQMRLEAAVQRLAAQEVEQSTEYFLQQFTPLLEPNPRAMKRLMNAYTISRAIAILSGVDLTDQELRRKKQLVLWTILSLRWPVLEDLLQDEPELADRIQGSGKQDGLPSDVEELLRGQEVLDVFKGKGVGTKLTSEAITFLGGSAQHEAPSVA